MEDIQKEIDEEKNIRGYVEVCTPEKLLVFGDIVLHYIKEFSRGY